MIEKVTAPFGISPEADAEIRARLHSVQSTGQKILLAVESGSRAWGFPSIDSDYDCRFLYVRPVADHLTLEQHRDVIEFPIVDDIDVGGWDLRKALLLALGGNAVVVEWATSPIRYIEDAGFQQRLFPVLDKIIDPARVSRHYLGLARSHITRIGSFSADVRLKKLFYLIRPIIALDWMRQRDFQQLPPMSMTQSLQETQIPSDVVAEINGLIERKAQSREMGEGPIPPILARYLESRYGHHELNLPPLARDEQHLADRRAIAGNFYREEVERY